MTTKTKEMVVVVAIVVAGVFGASRTCSLFLLLGSTRYMYTYMYIVD